MTFSRIAIETAVDGLSINAENELVYNRPDDITAAITATIKVTDADGATKTIEITIGAVNQALQVGDANCDGIISTLDALFILNYCTEIYTDFTEDQVAACDVNVRRVSLLARMKVEILFSRKVKHENYTIFELKEIIRRCFMSYWNNRQIGGRVANCCRRSSDVRIMRRRMLRSARCKAVFAAYKPRFEKIGGNVSRDIDKITCLHGRCNHLQATQSAILL